MAAGKQAGRLQGAKELLADRSSCLCFDQTICFLGSEETANVHAVRFGSLSKEAVSERQGKYFPPFLEYDLFIDKKKTMIS